MSERGVAMPNISPESVQQKAETKFESREIALKWLEHPVSALGGAVPSLRSGILKDADKFIRLSPRSSLAT